MRRGNVREVGEKRECRGQWMRRGKMGEEREGG